MVFFLSCIGVPTHATHSFSATVSFSPTLSVLCMGVIRHGGYPTRLTLFGTWSMGISYLPRFLLCASPLGTHLARYIVDEKVYLAAGRRRVKRQISAGAFDCLGRLHVA